MRIAIVKNNKVVNVLICDIESALLLWNNGTLGDIDNVIESPSGYGIGDYYINGEWSKAELEPQEIIEPVNSILSNEEITEILKTRWGI